MLAVLTHAGQLMFYQDKKLILYVLFLPQGWAKKLGAFQRKMGEDTYYML